MLENEVHFALTLKTLNSFRREPIVDEPIIALQKNCESTEIIILLDLYLNKTNFFLLFEKKYLFHFKEHYS